MFGIFVNKNEIAEEATKSIRNEIDELRRNLASDVSRICSEYISAMSSSFAERLSMVNSSLEEQMQQSLRYERRRQMALESILENQDKTLQALEHQEITPPIEALTSLAENFALTRLAKPDTPESTILYDKLINLMNCFDLTLVSETGVNFDPEKHEACGARCVQDSQDGTVLEIVRPGFLLRGKVLRCATVVVNRHDCGGVDNGRSTPDGLGDVP